LVLFTLYISTIKLLVENF